MTPAHPAPDPGDGSSPDLREDGYPTVRHVRLPVCEGCIAREGQECHTPGCLFWMHDVRDVPLLVADYAAIEAEQRGESLDTVTDMLDQRGVAYVEDATHPVTARLAAHLTELDHG